MKGKRIKKEEWIHGSTVVLRLEVDAIRPDDDPDQAYFDVATVRLLERLQQLADEGNVSELSKHGAVYVRQSA